MSGLLTGRAATAALDYLTGYSLDLGTAPQTMQLALLTAPPPSNPTLAQINEVGDAGYARQNVTWAVATDPTPGQASQITTAANILYGPFTSVAGLQYPATNCALIGSAIPASVGTNVLTANQADIETDATGWTNLLNATLAQSAAQFHTGTHSLAVTSTAAGDTQVAVTPTASAVPYTQYKATAWAYTTATGTTASLGLNYYDVSNNSLSATTGSAVTLTASTWTMLTYSAWAPANTVHTTPVLHSNPTTGGSITYWDTISVAPALENDILMVWQFDTPGQAAQNESLQISAGSLVMTLG